LTCGKQVSENYQQISDLQIAPNPFLVLSRIWLPQKTSISSANLILIIWYPNQNQQIRFTAGVK
jgi:hypothetical protein